MYYSKKQTLQLLDCGIKSFKDFVSGFQITKRKINREVLYSKVDIDKALLEINHVHETYKKQYYTNKQCKEMGISTFTITKKLERVLIPDKYRFFEYKKLECLFNKDQNYFMVKNKLIRFKDALELLPFTQSHGLKNLRNILQEHNFTIDYTLDTNSGHVYNDDVSKLLQLINDRYKFNKAHYFTLQQCRDLGLEKPNMKLLNKKKPDSLDLVYEFESVLMLYEIKSVEELLAKKSAIIADELICEKDISRELGFITISKFRKIVKEYGINSKARKTTQEKKLYKKNEFIELQKVIQDKYKFNRKHYYNAKDLKKLGITPYEISKFSFVKAEVPDQVHEFSHAINLYLKQEVDNYLLSIHKSNITKRVIHEEVLLNLQEFNLNDYVKSEDVKQLLGYTIAQILPFARKYNLKLEILSSRRLKNDNTRYRVTDTYYLKKDLIAIKKAKDKVLHEQEKIKSIKETERLRRLKEKTTARELALKTKEAEKLRRLEEKATTRELILKIKETKKVAETCSHERGLETKEYYIRKKMTGYKNRILDGENIKVLFLEALKDLEYVEGDIQKNSVLSKWIDFLTRKLNATSTNGRTLYKKFSKYLSLTKDNQENRFLVNLSNLTTKELNIMFFNSSSDTGKQEEIYTFLKYYSNLNDTKYNFQDLKNPYKSKRKITEKNKDNKEIYSITEYIELIKFVSDISTHKKEIEFWHNLKSTSRVKYRSYQSVWLYVILTLNNMWRNFDILTKVPVITLPFRFKTFENFFENELTIEEAKVIIAELTAKYKTFKSSKADKDGHFFCSDELILPLTNALIACVLYKEAYGQSYVIEHTSDFTLAPAMQKIFFKNFNKPSFKFKTKKMNSTLTTYSYEYLKKYTNENPILVTSLMRPHADINTTNHYIHLPKDQINHITQNLFEGGYFGYTFDYMYRLITNEKANLLEFDKKKHIITLFKDANKIQNISSQLLFIETKYKSLHEYLNSLNKDDIEHHLNLISLKQLPAKEKHWQCILGECLYLNRSCISCPFAIPHFYSLTVCMENLLSLLNQYKTLNSQSNNEKKFLGRRIFQYLLYLSEAKKEFGGEFINEFSNGNFNLILDEISNLSDLTSFINPPRGDS